MRVLITGGGTGGHVYPALAVADELVAHPRWHTTEKDIAWVGVAGNIEEEIIDRSNYDFLPVASGAIRGSSPLQLAKSVVHLARGVREARAHIRAFRPDAVLATGGYVAAPLILAARRERVPAVILLPDMEPGMAVKYLSRLVEKVAVSFKEVTQHFPPGKATVTGYPVRPALFEQNRYGARRNLGLESEGLVLLVLGGSRGARSINTAVEAMITRLLPLTQVIHLCGLEGYPHVKATQERLPNELSLRYRVYPYLHKEMLDALAAADLVVARAGAATLAEFPAAILVPYPYAGRHQELNAAYLAAHGTGVVLSDDALESQLESTVRGLLQDTERLQAMREASRALAVPEASANVAALLQRIAGGRS